MLRHSIRLVAWGASLVGSAALGWACGSSDPAVAPPTGADASAVNPFGSSPCGQCLQAACSSPVQACASDPECGSWLDCRNQCDTTSSGGIDAPCAAACPAPSSQGAAVAQADVQSCFLTSQSACAACGGAGDAGADSPDAATQHPILTQDCPTSPETVPCWKCEDERCCDTYQTCKANGDCEAFTQCMKACSSDDLVVCTNECAAAHEAGYDDYLRRMACIQVRCPEDCGENTDPCWACGSEKCGDALVTCLADRGCDLYTNCSSACADDVCLAACASAYPGASALFDAYTDCLAVHCVAFCGEL